MSPEHTATAIGAKSPIGDPEANCQIKTRHSGIAARMAAAITTVLTLPRITFP